MQYRLFMYSVCVYVFVLIAQWEPVPSDHWFFLGEPVYFVAQTGALLAEERLYLDSCYATISRDPNSKPKVDIITNYGCVSSKNTVIQISSRIGLALYMS